MISANQSPGAFGDQGSRAAQKRYGLSFTVDACARWPENDFDLSRTAPPVLTMGSASDSFEYERGLTASAFNVLKAANRIVKIEIEYRAIRATITQVLWKRTFF